MAHTLLRDSIQVVKYDDPRLELIDAALFECLLALDVPLFMRYDLAGGQKSNFAFRVTTQDATTIAMLSHRLQNHTAECYRFWGE